MSDPVTNVEIEDVLSSIRRLVSDGDKARSHKPVQVEPQHEAVVERSDAQSADPESAPEPISLNDRFVLTPAFLVVDEDNQTRDAAAVPANDTQDASVADTSAEDTHAKDAATEGDDRRDDTLEHHSDDAENATGNQSDDGPLELTEMVWDEAEEPSGGDETPDRADLVATIAELEAAISAGGDDYEPDGGETMAETIPWPGAVARDTDDVEEAEVAQVEAAPQTDDDKAQTDAPQGRQDDPAPDTVQDDDEGDVYGDDDLDGLLDVGGVSLDEEALRELVADVVRQELSGNLGEKITRNVRKLVRREIYRILSSQEFD